jgi:hypothetical protein
MNKNKETDVLALYRHKFMSANEFGQDEDVYLYSENQELLQKAVAGIQAGGLRDRLLGTAKRLIKELEEKSN